MPSSDIDFSEHRQHRHEDRPRLPDIPDLRFEYSYVRSVRPFVQVERVSTVERTEYEPVDASEEKTNLKAGELAVRSSEVITVMWGKVLWVTFRDQVLSPFIQGTLWALASYYLSPMSAQVGSRLGSYVHQKLPSKEGTGISWLRSKLQSAGLSRKNA